MLDRFEAFIQKHQLIQEGETVLLALSGGVDSICMLSLFRQTKYPLAIAHCNFALRGAESDADAQFVKQAALTAGITYHERTFTTQEYADEHGISIQMAARELRYDWFSLLKAEFGYHRIATAHHLDDSIETFMINLNRGTGIEGLKGIAPQSADVIRPLLFANKQEIRSFVAANEIAFREDSSNLDDHYQRNWFRHHILKPWDHQYPAFSNRMADNFQRIAEAAQIYREAVDERTETIKQQLTKGRLSKDAVRKLSPISTLLFEALHPYGFSELIVNNIIASLDAQSGKQFLSATHRLTLDRDELILTKNKQEEAKEYSIDLANQLVQTPVMWEMEIKAFDGEAIPNDSNIAYLDKRLIREPFVLRKWKSGDRFQPLGMKGMKKISDFLIDQKVPLPEKENCWLFESAGKIVYLAGHRISDSFKLSDTTTEVCIIKWKV